MSAGPIRLDLAAARLARVVEPVYRLLGWEWEVGRGSETEQVDLARLTLVIHRKLREAAEAEANGKGETFSCSSGGLTVYIEQPDSEDAEAWVSFTFDVGVVNLATGRVETFGRDS